MPGFRWSMTKFQQIGGKGILQTKWTVPGNILPPAGKQRYLESKSDMNGGEGMLNLDCQTEVLIFYLVNRKESQNILNHSVLNQSNELGKLIQQARVEWNPGMFTIKLVAKEVVPGIEDLEEQ